MVRSTKIIHFGEPGGKERGKNHLNHEEVPLTHGTYCRIGEIIILFNDNVTEVLMELCDFPEGGNNTSPL